MGQTLSEPASSLALGPMPNTPHAHSGCILPVTDKHTTMVLRNKQYWVGISDMQGWRISMEDSHTVHLYLPPGGSSEPPVEAIAEQPVGSTVTNAGDQEKGPALVGVFDGHGGSSVAKFSGTTLHTRLANLDAYKAGDYDTALKQAFLKTDEDLRADPSFFNDPSGCTAVVGIITTDGRIIVANAGDSRAVLGYKGEAKAMSEDHKPTNAEETARITAAGGFVEFGRVNGNLALSRAIGDFEFKQNYTLQPEQQIVTVDPEIMTHTVDGEEEFLVLACDGIWDCLSSQQVIDFVRRAVANGDDLGKICEDMMLKCLAPDSETGGVGCDNMTVVIVALLGGRTKEEWQAWVKERVQNKVGRDTPESIPDVFGHSQAASAGAVAGGGGGFRVAGAGGLVSIASILGASGITFRTADDHDEDDLHIINPTIHGHDDDSVMVVDDHGAKLELVDDAGDAHIDSEDSDATAGAADGEGAQTRTPAFSSIGSPTVPTPESLQPARSGHDEDGAKPAQ